MNFKVYFDNWFTFLELQVLLRSWSIWTIGTIRSNRLRGCKLKSENELCKSGRGSVDSCVDTKSGIAVVRWMDNSAVQLSSTHVAVETMASVKRWDRKQRKYITASCPAIVKEYNTHMGGVDLFDMLMSMYRVDHKSTKWYRRIFFWVINVSIVNGWLLYRRHSSQRLVPVKEQLDLIEFTTVVSQSLIFRNKLHSYFSRKRGRQSVYNVHTDTGPRDKSNCPKKRSATLHTSEETHYDTVGHYPTHAEPK